MLPDDWRHALETIMKQLDSKCEMKLKPAKGYGEKRPPTEWPRCTWNFNEDGVLEENVYYESKHLDTGDDSLGPEVKEFGPDAWPAHVAKVYNKVNNRFFFRLVEPKDTITERIDANPSRADEGTPCPNDAPNVHRLKDADLDLEPAATNVDGSPAKRRRRSSKRRGV